MYESPPSIVLLPFSIFYSFLGELLTSFIKTKITCSFVQSRTKVIVCSTIPLIGYFNFCKHTLIDSQEMSIVVSWYSCSIVYSWSPNCTVKQWSNQKVLLVKWLNLNMFVSMVDWCQECSNVDFSLCYIQREIWSFLYRYQILILWIFYIQKSLAEHLSFNVYSSFYDNRNDM